MNGIATLGENIADNVGLRLALDAFERHEAASGGGVTLSARRLFFLSYANAFCGSLSEQAAVEQLLGDAHSPMRVRVVAPLANSVRFSEAFNCAAGSAMNPREKCRLW